MSQRIQISDLDSQTVRRWDAIRQFVTSGMHADMPPRRRLLLEKIAQCGAVSEKSLSGAMVSSIWAQSDRLSQELGACPTSTDNVGKAEPKVCECGKGEVKWEHTYILNGSPTTEYHCTHCVETVLFLPLARIDGRLVPHLPTPTDNVSECKEPGATVRRREALKVDAHIRAHATLTTHTGPDGSQESDIVGNPAPMWYGRAQSGKGWAKLPSYLTRAYLRTRCHPDTHTDTQKGRVAHIATRAPTFSDTVTLVPYTKRHRPTKADKAHTLGLEVYKRVMRDHSVPGCIDNRDKVVEGMYIPYEYLPSRQRVPHETTSEHTVRHLPSPSDISRQMVTKVLHWTPKSELGVQCGCKEDKGHWCVQPSYHQLHGRTFWDTDLPALTFSHMAPPKPTANILAPTCVRGTDSPAKKTTVSYIERRCKFLSGKRYQRKGKSAKGRKVVKATPKTDKVVARRAKALFTF